MGNLGPTLSRASQSSTTSGTGTANLDGSAASTYQTWSSAGAVSGVVYPYLITDGAAWELGTGTYTSGSPATLSRTLRMSSTGSLLSLSGSAVISCVEAREDMAEAYYTGNTNSVSTGTMGGAVALDSMTVTIPASNVQRIFMINAMCTYSGSHGMRGTVTLDGTLKFPTQSSAGFNSQNSGDGLFWLGCSGIPITIPGDGSSHTIALTGQAQSSTAALTLDDRWIVATKVG